MAITVTAHVRAPIERVWEAYVTPADIMAWNAASDDWHCPAARSDLRPGGVFVSRMEARDGSMGFDFEGIWTVVDPPRRLEYDFGGRHAVVTFREVGDAVAVSVTFDPETEYPIEQQREGWQAILDRFARYVENGA
jgi:uncharacterized protein YndB with AHSA1/START domain